MNEQLQKLEALLERVQRNALAPRPVAESAPAAPPAPIPARSPGSIAEAFAGSLAEDPNPPGDSISGVVVASAPGIDEAPPEELLDDDIVEVPATAVEPIEGLDEGEAEMEPPASSRRPKVAGTLDEALAAAAQELDLDDEREVPIKTPPPESGPQAAMPLPSGIQAPAAPDVQALLEEEMAAEKTVRHRPTPEQLGQTIDLDERPGPALELGEPIVTPSMTAAPASEELEAPVPSRESRGLAGTYDESLRPPPEARDELEAHRRRVGDASGEALSAMGSMHTAEPRGPTPAVTTESTVASVSTVTVESPEPAAPEVVARPNLVGVRPAMFMRGEAFRPGTFLELLDASLELGRD